MIRPCLFLTLLGLLLGSIVYVGGYTPPGDPFIGSSEEVVVDLMSVPTSTVAALKIRHASAMPSVDIGLFGNSRVLAVSASDIAYPRCRFFNFALSGESVRASVAVLERLAAIGKVPRISVIGIDNFESQYYSNPAWPTPIEQWRLAWSDLMAGWPRQDISMRNWLRMGWRHMHTSAETLRYRFTRQFLMSGARLWLGPGIHDQHVVDSRRPFYRLDGSLSYEVAGRDQKADSPLQSAPEQIIPGYLRHDLGRLARLAVEGRRVIIYETPVAPASAYHFTRQPSVHAQFHRAIFLDECRKLGLLCHVDPGLFAPDAAWRDASHPPPGPLGTYIQTLVSDAVAGAGNGICADDI